MKKIRNLLFVVCLLISLGVFTSCKKKVELVELAMELFTKIM